MNAKQREVFEQKWRENSAMYNANPPMPDGEISERIFDEETVDRGRCEHIINAVIEAGVPEMEWQPDDEKTDNECKDWRGIVNGSVMLEVWEDEEEQWLVTGIGASNKYCLSLHGQSYSSFAEAKSAAGEAFRAWWLKAQGEQDEGTLKSAV